MSIANKQNINYELDFLICTLFVLSSTDLFFKEVNLKKDIYFGFNGKTIPAENFNSFYYLLNKITLRQFSYILIRPILFKKLLSSKGFSSQDHDDLVEQAILLKKYLKKFREVYYRYFLRSGRDQMVPLSNKEINSFALKNLFLIVGI